MHHDRIMLVPSAQIDLRFANPAQGNLEVVVAPVLRFADVGYNAGESRCLVARDGVINAHKLEVFATSVVASAGVNVAWSRIKAAGQHDLMSSQPVWTALLADQYWQPA